MTEVIPVREARRLVRRMNEWLDGFDPSIYDYLASAAVAGLAWGWWQFVVRSSRSVVRLCEQSATEIVPAMVRIISEHAMAIVWLVDVGDPGAQAMWQVNEEHRARLIEQLLQDDITVPAVTVPPAPEQYDAPEVATARRLLDNAELRHESYQDGDPYTAYRLLSQYVHPTLETASLFVHADPDGTARLLRHVDPGRVQDTSESAVQHVTLACLLSAQAFRKVLRCPALDNAIASWGDTIGTLPVLPQLRATTPPTAAPVNLAAAVQRVRELLVDPQLAHALDRLAAGDLPPETPDQRAALSALNRAEDRLRRLRGWA
jgi:hypothetical protein